MAHNLSKYLSEEELIEYVKPYLKSKGFKKKNKRWTKDIGDFTICFYIQGSQWDKKDYYIRPGIFINELLSIPNIYYGDWWTEIEQTTPEAIMREFEQWCDEWTNKALIKERYFQFVEWDKRNPLEKRRAELVDYKKDPCPAEEFFALRDVTQKYILDNF